MSEIITSIRARLNCPIILIGLMGAGKSHVGSGLAGVLGLPYADVDKEIERMQGCSVAALLKQGGEPYFRELERNTLQSFLGKGSRVISPGGGAVMDTQTADIIWKDCISIWLRADLDVLLERTSKTTSARFFTKGTQRQILGDLMEIRTPVYAQANMIVDSNSSDVSVTVEKTLHALYDYLKTDRI